MTSSELTTDSFWDYSVQIYSKSGVADVLLSLQEQYGVDVNMLLFCCWVGLTRGTFTDELFDTAYEFSYSWREHAVNPLRHARTWMKETGCQSTAIDREECMSVREKVKSVELRVEKLQQETLESVSSIIPETDLPVVEQQNAVVSNLKKYLGAADINPDDKLIDGLEEIMQANFLVQDISPGLLS